ncbi:ankyrin repeat and SOCS box protein 10-like isoform X1 [Pomacea canaliculata]|uniref:ankyrin repeat and SOCS box protein 10-like isoform X1 n=1 Tax=Pomacea canaliculata TaxID=400727 RepID=UPI000D7301FA|nr:ankyrin repeat and SOCS box protein 10-like isoform X1 [Pomacea canaliculata]
MAERRDPQANHQQSEDNADNDTREARKTTPPPSSTAKSDSSKPAILQEENLMQLLADAITYRSSLSDISIVLKCGAKVNASVKRGLRPLHYAVYADYVECVRLLIDQGADVNITDDIGYTPIHLCARKGNIASMKILIEHGARVDFFTGDEDVDENSKALGYLTIEPLNLAIENNHVDCLRLLLESGARPDHRYFMGYEINLVPLEHLECLEILLQYGADPNVFNRCGMTPLMKACRQQKLQAARLLLTYGALVDLQSPPRFEQKTALHYAVTSGNLAVVHVLLRHGASPARPPDYKYAALHAAVLCDRPDICEMLIRWGAQVDEVTDECTTPLMLACGTRGLCRQVELVQLLLDKGADPNAHSEFVTYTAPYLSALPEYLRTITADADQKVVHLLLQHGARVHFRVSASHIRVTDPFGILSYVQYIRNNDNIFELLAQAGALFDVDAIRSSNSLTSWQKQVLLRLAANPRELKHLVRLKLHTILRPNFPHLVEALPLPAIMRNFLVYH